MIERYAKLRRCRACDGKGFTTQRNADVYTFVICQCEEGKRAAKLKPAWQWTASSNPVIDDMIARNCWSPEKSGYRPLANATEALMLIDERKLVMRGTTGYPITVTRCYANGAVIEWELGGRKWRMSETYEQLFKSYKFQDNSYPIGLPGEQVNTTTRGAAGDD